MPLANYAVKRLINSLRLMLDTSAFHFLFCGNLAFIAELWFIMQPLCFTRQSFFVKSFFHSRQGRKFSILWSLVVIVTWKRVKELKRVRGVWFRNRLRCRNRTYDHPWHFLCSNFSLAFSMTIPRLIDGKRRDFASILRQIATGLEWVILKDVWECDLVKVARDWALFNTVLITGCTTNWRANWYCIQFYWSRRRRNGVLSVCGMGLFVVGWGTVDSRAAVSSAFWSPRKHRNTQFINHA